MAAESGFANPDDDDGSALRPAWEDTEDETDTDRLGIARAPRLATASHGSAWPAGENLRTLLGPLCAATDMLARLDARTAAAPAPVREGLIARMAFAEAAGWLAHAHAWGSVQRLGGWGRERNDRPNRCRLEDRELGWVLHGAASSSRFPSHADH